MTGAQIGICPACEKEFEAPSGPGEVICPHCATQLASVGDGVWTVRTVHQNIPRPIIVPPLRTPPRSPNSKPARNPERKPMIKTFVVLCGAAGIVFLCWTLAISLMTKRTPSVSEIMNDFANQQRAMEAEQKAKAERAKERATWPRVKLQEVRWTFDKYRGGVYIKYTLVNGPSFVPEICVEIFPGGPSNEFLNTNAFCQYNLMPLQRREGEQCLGSYFSNIGLLSIESFAVGRAVGTIRRPHGDESCSFLIAEY